MNESKMSPDITIVINSIKIIENDKEIDADALSSEDKCEGDLVPCDSENELESVVELEFGCELIDAKLLDNKGASSLEIGDVGDGVRSLVCCPFEPPMLDVKKSNGLELS